MNDLEEAMNILTRKAQDGTLTEADTLFAIAAGTLHVAVQLAGIREELAVLHATIANKGPQ